MKELHQSGFANIRQVQDALTYLGVPLHERLENAAPSNQSFIRKFFDNAQGDKPGLTVCTNFTQPLEPEAVPCEFKEIVYCDNSQTVIGRATIFPSSNEKWRLNTIAVEGHLQATLRRDIANQLYNVLFTEDWIHLPKVPITKPAIKARWRQYRNRLQNLLSEALESTFDQLSPVSHLRTAICYVLNEID